MYLSYSDFWEIQNTEINWPIPVPLGGVVKRFEDGHHVTLRFLCFRASKPNSPLFLGFCLLPAFSPGHPRPMLVTVAAPGWAHLLPPSLLPEGLPTGPDQGLFASSFFSLFHPDAAVRVTTQNMIFFFFYRSLPL